MACHGIDVYSSFSGNKRGATQSLYLFSRGTSCRKISWSLEAARFGFRIFQSFYLRHIGSGAAETHIQFQSDTSIITSDPSASTLHETWQQYVLPFSE